MKFYATAGEKHKGYYVVIDLDWTWWALANERKVGTIRTFLDGAWIETRVCHNPKLSIKSYENLKAKYGITETHKYEHGSEREEIEMSNVRIAQWQKYGKRVPVA